MIKAVSVCDICGQETPVYVGRTGPKLSLSYIGYMPNACVCDPGFDVKSLLDKSVNIDLCEGCANKISQFISQMYKNERKSNYARSD